VHENIPQIQRGKTNGLKKYLDYIHYFTFTPPVLETHPVLTGINCDNNWITTDTNIVGTDFLLCTMVQ